MIDRRTFTALLAGTVAAPQLAFGQGAKKTVFYSSVGADLTLYSMDEAAATLTKQGTERRPDGGRVGLRARQR